jgi:hypothetical protein
VLNIVVVMGDVIATVYTFEPSATDVSSSRAEGMGFDSHTKHCLYISTTVMYVLNAWTNSGRCFK